MLVCPPEQSLAQFLSDCLTRTPRFGEFRVAVAWASLKGVEMLAPALDSYKGHATAIVGLMGRTSYEALYALYERVDDLYVFWKHPMQTFHPKTYLFIPDPKNSGTDAILVVGSSNLTAGGLASNIEVNVALSLCDADPEGRKLLRRTVEHLESFVKSPFCHRADSPEYLKKLFDADYVLSEAALRRKPEIIEGGK